MARRIREHEGLEGWDANLQAVRRIETWLRASILAHQSVGVETVLSTNKYRKLVRLAHRQGFAVRLIYVVLNSVELNVQRVKLRAAKGGHDVPESRITDRRRRSFGELPWFLVHADQVEMLDNSRANPEIIATKIGNVIDVFGDIPGELVTAISRAAAGDLKSPARTTA